MKKFMFLICTLVLMCSATLSFADMGAPEFEYDVYVGLSGWSVVMTYQTNEVDEYGGFIWAEKTVKFSPGTKLTIGVLGGNNYQFSNPNAADEYAYVNKEDVDKHTIEAGEIIGKEAGTKCEPGKYIVNTQDSDLSMRIGPAKGYPSVCGIPKDTEVTYDYTYKNGDITWAFVNYNGKEGWVNSAYLAEKAEVEENNEAEVTDIAQPEDEPPVEKAGMPRTTVIVIAIMGAVIAALTALVIILIIKRRNNGNRQ